MEDYVYSKLNKSRKRKSKKIWLFLVLIIIGGFFSLLFLKTSFTISQISDSSSQDNENEKGHIDAELPKDNPNRINVLLLGMRGIHESGDGKLLTDAITIASIDKKTKEVALISLPRDLYVQLWCHQDKKKVNFAYFEGDLDCAKKTVSHITGLYIDYGIVVNFTGLKDIIDALGGITIHRETEFTESVQWAKEGKENSKYWFIKEFEINDQTSARKATGTIANRHATNTDDGIKNSTTTEERWVFYVPEGTTEMDGETALYYTRSRYTSNDFERTKRQQEVLMAIKDKALSLGVLTNPVKLYNILDAVGDNLKTDMEITDIRSLVNLASELQKQNIKTRTFDTEDNGLLYDTFINEQYVLLPEGDNFDKIRQVCKNIFKKK